MLAAPLVGPRKIQIEDIEAPSCSQRTVLINMKATAICGSDIKYYRTAANISLPRVLGHEMTGVVIDKGGDVRKLNIGERVIVQPALSCGACQLCYEGRDNICLAGGLRGITVDGGFAEYIVVDERDAFRLPDTTDYAEGTQIQTLATVCHAQSRLQLEPGQSVLVIGLGATGLLHVQLAKASGATPILGVDLSPQKLEIAKELGVDVTICMPDDSALEKIRDATRGHGPSSVIEAVGIPSTVALSIEAVAPGGKVLMFGSCPEPLSGFDPLLIYYKEINIIGTRSASRGDWQSSIDLVESGNIMLKPLITHRMAFQDIEKAFALMDEGSAELIRIVILGASD